MCRGITSPTFLSPLQSTTSKTARAQEGCFCPTLGHQRFPHICTSKGAGWNTQRKEAEQPRVESVPAVLGLSPWQLSYGFREPRSSRQGGTYVSSLLKGVVVLTTPGHWVAVAVGPGTQPSTPTSHSGRAQKPYTTPDTVETPVKLLQHSHAPPPPMQRRPSLKESQMLGKGPTSQ